MLAVGFARAEQRVDLVDENHRGFARRGDGEERANHLLALADPLGRQRGRRDGEEGGAALRRDGATDQRLARSGRAEEQQTARHGARAAEQLGLEQRPHRELLHRSLGVLQTRDVGPLDRRGPLQNLAHHALDDVAVHLEQVLGNRLAAGGETTHHLLAERRLVRVAAAARAGRFLTLTASAAAGAAERLTHVRRHVPVPRDASAAAAAAAAAAFAATGVGASSAARRWSEEGPSWRFRRRDVLRRSRTTRHRARSFLSGRTREPLRRTSVATRGRARDPFGTRPSPPPPPPKVFLCRRCERRRRRRRLRLRRAGRRAHERSRPSRVSQPYTGPRRGEARGRAREARRRDAPRRGVPSFWRSPRACARTRRAREGRSPRRGDRACWFRRGARRRKGAGRVVVARW